MREKEKGKEHHASIKLQMARNLNADEIHRRGTRRAAAHEICKRSLGRKSSIRKHTKAGIWARPVSSYYY